MTKIFFVFCLVTAFFTILLHSAFAFDFCVDPAGGGTHTDLQAALTQAAGNGQNDTIKVVQGIYLGNFSYNSNEGYNLMIEGGYTSGCGCRKINPANTVLDGNMSGRVLVLEDTDGGDILVEGFTVRNGSGGSNHGGGIYARSYSSLDSAGDITIKNNIVTGNNVADGYGGGIFSSSYAVCSDVSSNSRQYFADQ